jgi:hypothetical protein
MNCGHGLAILGPCGMTIEYAFENAEVVEETKLCCECADDANVGEAESAWVKWMSWRRGGKEME